MGEKHTSKRASISLLTAALLMVFMVGCQSNEQREEWTEQADNRWLNLRSNMMLGMAQQQFETGDLDQARDTLDDAMQLDPGNAQLHVLAGRIAMEEGRLEQAYHLFDTAQELDENEARAYYYQGVVLQRWQRFEAAERTYRRAYELRSDRPSYLLAVSDMLVERGELDEALSMLEQRLDYFDQSAAVRAQLGHLYRLKNEPEQAVVYFKEASLMKEDKEENQKLREELGLAQFDAGDYQAAILTLEGLLDEPGMSKRRDLRRTLARAYLNVGRNGQAQQTYLELARSPQGEAEDWLSLGRLAWQAEELGSALQAAHQVIELAPQRYEGYLLAGMVWHKRERLDDALSMFDRAAELDQTRTEPLIMRGLALQRADRHGAAREAYERALERDPDDPRARRLLRALDASAAAIP